jgi:hypothetical protein
VTAQFSYAGRQRRQDFYEPGDADGIRKMLASCGLPVESPGVVNFWATVPQWDLKAASEFD